MLLFMCFFCADLLLLSLKVSRNSVIDSSGNESPSQVKFSPCILIPPPNFLFWKVFKYDTRSHHSLKYSWESVHFLNCIVNETSGKILNIEIFLMIKTLDKFSKLRMNLFSYLNLNDPIAVSFP